MSTEDLHDRRQERREQLDKYWEEPGSDDDGGSTARAVLRAARPSNLRNSVEELVDLGETEQDPQAHARSPTQVYSGSVDVDWPDPETEDYWTEYERNPVISTQIESLGFEVFEAGYWVEADSDETEEEIAEFLEEIGVYGTQTHRPFIELGKQALTQYMVRGTFLGEKMKSEVDGEQRHVGISPFRSTSVKMYTKPGTPVLIPPDFTGSNGRGAAKTTDDGKAAAYVQYDNQFTRWQDRDERRFAKDEVLHWARNPDVGQSRGNSVIEPVYIRSLAYREKLQDNDLAISMKAWPMILFQMGSAEHPWTDDEMENFLDTYMEGELGPATFQGVPGDIDVHEFAGETADIQNHVSTDVDHIVAGMPGPRYALGSFATEEMSDATTGAHERQYRKLIRSLRLDLENLFTPYLRDVAESWDLDPSGLELHIGRPGDEVAPEDVQGSIIRYQSDADDDGDNGDQSDDNPGVRTVANDDSADESDGGSSEQSSQNGAHGQSEAALSSGHNYEREDAIAQLASPLSSSEFNDEFGVRSDELADPRLVSIADIEDDASSALGDPLIDVRDRTLDEFEGRASADVLPSSRAVEVEFEGELGTTMDRVRIVDDVEDICYDVLERTKDTLSQQTHYPNINMRARAEHTSLVDATISAIETDLYDLGREMASEYRQQMDRVRNEDGDVSDFADRVRGVYTEDVLRHRAILVVRMNAKQLINRIKLLEYERSDDVVGVTVIAQCTDDTHRLTEELSNCSGDRTVARFDADADIGEQFQRQLPASISPPSGFDPLPEVPPYHFGDRAELGPVYE